MKGGGSEQQGIQDSAASFLCDRRARLDDRREMPAVQELWRDQGVAYMMARLVPPFVVALAFRLAWLVIIEPQQVGDSMGYLLAARTLASDGVLSWYLMPGYTALLALLGESFQPFVTPIMSALAIVPVACIGRAITGRPGVGILAAWIVAVHPDFIAYASVIHPRHAYVLLLPFAFLAAYRMRRLAWLSSGVFLWLASMFRGESYFMLPFLLWILYRRQGIRSAAQCAVVFAVLAGCLVYILPSGGSAARTFAMSHSPRAYGDNISRVPSHDDPGVVDALSYIASNPWQTAKNSVVMPIRKMWAPSAYGVSGSTLELVTPESCNECDGVDWSYTEECQSIPRADLPPWVSVYKYGAVTFYLFLLFLSAPYFVFGRGRCVLISVIAGNWIAHVVFYSASQYRYMPEMLLSVAAAWTMYNAFISSFVRSNEDVVIG